jgi:hypothetical protein
MLKLHLYVWGSIFAFVGLVVQRLSHYEQFYPAMYNIGNSTLNLVVLWNTFFAVLLYIGAFVKFMCLGSLREHEVEVTMERAKISFISLFFSFSFIHEEVDFMFFAAVSLIMMLVASHWIAELRFEFVCVTSHLPIHLLQSA